MNRGACFLVTGSDAQRSELLTMLLREQPGAGSLFATTPDATADTDPDNHKVWWYLKDVSPDTAAQCLFALVPPPLNLLRSMSSAAIE